MEKKIMIRIAITARTYDYHGLRRELNKDEKIVILSCDSCAKLSDGLGGKIGGTSLAEKLTADGFLVTHKQMLSSVCAPDQLRESVGDEEIGKLFLESDVIIPLACRAGIDRVEENLPQLRILKVTETLGFGTYSPERGARLTEPAEDIKIAIDNEEGITLAEAAARLDLYSGSF